MLLNEQTTLQEWRDKCWAQLESLLSESMRLVVGAAFATKDKEGKNQVIRVLCQTGREEAGALIRQIHVLDEALAQPVTEHPDLRINSVWVRKGTEDFVFVTGLANSTKTVTAEKLGGPPVVWAIDGFLNNHEYRCHGTPQFIEWLKTARVVKDVPPMECEFPRERRQSEATPNVDDNYVEYAPCKACERIMPVGHVCVAGVADKAEKLPETPKANTENLKAPVWTKEEVAFIVKNNGKLKAEEVAAKLGKTKSAVESKRYALLKAGKLTKPTSKGRPKGAQTIPAWVKKIEVNQPEAQLIVNVLRIAATSLTPADVSDRLPQYPFKRVLEVMSYYAEAVEGIREAHYKERPRLLDQIGLRLGGYLA